MKRIILFALICVSLPADSQVKGKSHSPKVPGKATIIKAALRDKIMGGWAGQTIGVTFGGPYALK